jgi:GLPGLI family protein
MKAKIFFILPVLFCSALLHAQQFIDKAVIEYEVKTNVKKTYPDDIWGEMMKDNLPTFKTGYFTFSFADNKSVYKFSHWEPNSKMPPYILKSDEENIWYFDFTNNKFNMQKDVYSNMFNVEDSIPVIEWRLTNESRVIAGFNCRKAVGKIMDSVYIFAFYTDEIAISGGPCSVNGLPGMILGLTIPRMYTSYMATKVSLSGVDVAAIKPVTVKKYYSSTSLKATIKERIKDWFNSDDENSKVWMNMFLWNLYL